MLTTYTNEFASAIRAGDIVTDSLGRTYTAQTDAEWLDTEQAYNVRGDGRWYSYETNDRVTLQFDPSLEDIE